MSANSAASADGLTDADRMEAVLQQRAARATQLARSRAAQQKAPQQIDSRDTIWSAHAQNILANLVHLTRGKGSNQNPWPNEDFRPYANGDKVPPMADFTFNGAAAYGLSFAHGLTHEQTNVFLLHSVLNSTRDAIRNYACANLFNTPDNQIGFLSEVRDLIMIGLAVRNNFPSLVDQDGEDEDDEDYRARVVQVLTAGNSLSGSASGAASDAEQEQQEQQEPQVEESSEELPKETKAQKGKKGKKKPEPVVESEESEEVEDADESDDKEDFEKTEDEEDEEDEDEDEEDEDEDEEDEEDEDDDDDDEDSVDLNPPARGKNKKAFVKPKGGKVRAGKNNKKAALKNFGRRR